MKFSEYYMTEGKTDIKAPEKIEEVFVDVINTGHTTAKRKRYEYAVKQIVDHLKLKGKAIHIGADQDGKLNDFYIKAVERLGMPSKDINKRSKTDIIVNRDRLSMKLDRGWIFSHQLNDSQACLEYVLENSDMKDTIALKVMDLFEELKSKQSNKLYELSDQKILRGKLVDTFIRLFENEEYNTKREFIRAGLRGTFKFEESNKAVADKLLVVKFTNKNIPSQIAMADINKIKLEDSNIFDLRRDNDYLDMLAEKTRVAFVIRQSGKLRMDINSVDMGSDILVEGIIDTIASLLKQGYEKVKEKLKQLINYLVELIRKGIGYFMDVLGLSFEVQMNNEIEF